MATTLAVVATSALAGAATASAAPGGANTGERATGSMTKVPVTALVSDTPDSAGRVKVRLADGKVVAIPASEKDRVLAHAAQQPDVSPNDVVVGDCGSSYVELAEKVNDHPVRMTTGFTVITAAISYGWEATIAGPSFAFTYDSSGGLAFRTSWDGSFDSPRDQSQGVYSAAVVPDFSYAILWTGDICVSGGPTDEELLTSPDTPISMPLSFRREGSAAPSGGDVKGAPGTSTNTEGSSPAFPGSAGQAPPPAVTPFADPTRVPDTTVYPYRAIAALQITDQNGTSFRCTGFFISTDTIATAGHCLHFAGVWARTVLVTPGQDAGKPPPFGTCQGTTAYTTTGWVADRDQRYDYGAVKLDCETGGQTGWFGLRWTSAPLTGTSITITGYPRDQAPTGSMWTNSGTISSDEERRVFYRILVGDEESGAPVYVPGCGQYCALAVHAYAPPIPGHTGEWGGTRITQAAFDNYQNWRS